MLERLPSGSRIAVIRLRSLGDCVLTTPALALLKTHRPDLRIGVVVEDRWRAVFEGNEILPPQSSVIRRWHPRAVLNLHGGFIGKFVEKNERCALNEFLRFFKRKPEKAGNFFCNPLFVQFAR